MSRPFKPIAALVLLAFAAGSAGAADLPKRKSGLWEMKTQMEGMPSPGAMQMCVDQSTDNMMEERAVKEKLNCSVMDVKRAGGRTTVHSVCKHEGTTVTTDAVITGDFESGYKNDMRVRYSPPQHGMSDMHMIQDAKWLGPCKPGQKPGDVMMPGMGGMPGGKVNVQEMMKDPQIQEMMKRQRQGGQY